MRGQSETPAKAWEGTEGLTALAIVTGSYLTVVIANLFQHSARAPTKVFKTKAQAMKWLGQFVDKSHN